MNIFFTLMVTLINWYNGVMWTCNYFEKATLNISEIVCLVRDIRRCCNVSLVFTRKFESLICIEMLESTIQHLIAYELENQRDDHGNLVLDEDLLLFPQDGTLPHSAVAVRQWLDTNYSNKRNRRRGPLGCIKSNLALTWGTVATGYYKQPLPTFVKSLKTGAIIICKAIITTSNIYLIKIFLIL